MRDAGPERPIPYLVGVQEEEGNHEGEQARGFGEGKAQDGVLEELGCSAKSRQLIAFWRRLTRVGRWAHSYLAWRGCERCR